MSAPLSSDGSWQHAPGSSSSSSTGPPQLQQQQQEEGSQCRISLSCLAAMGLCWGSPTGLLPQQLLQPCLLLQQQQGALSPARLQQHQVVVVVAMGLVPWLMALQHC